MPQDDYNVANDSGANTRTDFNNQLSAIVQNNSGATEPSTMFAHMFWADTSPSGYSIFKVRNAANAAWATCFDDEGRWKGIAGTVGEPSVTSNSDTDTGLYWPAANQLAFTLGGTNVLELTQTRVTITDGTPNLELYETDQALDSKIWRLYSAGGVLSIATQDDARVGTFNVMTFTRGSTGPITTEVPLQINSALILDPTTITTDTTPTAFGRTMIIIGAWTAANNITDFDNETAGQRLTILGGDSDCNVVDGAPIQLVGNATWNGAAGATLELLSSGGIWYELSRSDAS